MSGQFFIQSRHIFIGKIIAYGFKNSDNLTKICSDAFKNGDDLIKICADLTKNASDTIKRGCDIAKNITNNIKTYSDINKIGKSVIPFASQKATSERIVLSLAV